MNDLSDHLRLELAHAVHVGHQPGEAPPLGPADPVPGCACTRCIIRGRGGSVAASEVGEGIVRQLALVDPADRLQAARRMRERVVRDLPGVPGPGWLCRQAAELPYALAPMPDPSDHDHDELPVKEARRVSILNVASRLGLGEPERRGREYVVRCPLHDDRDPSLRLNDDEGLWYCFPCGEGGDLIELAQAAQGYDFPEAVEWIASDAGTHRRHRKAAS